MQSPAPPTPPTPMPPMPPPAPPATPAAGAPVTVVCMKWGTKFGAEFANKLCAMTRRHLVRPHRFVCLTDNADGLDAGVTALPLPAMDLPPGKERGWRKLSVLDAGFLRSAGITGAVLFLDLDVVVTGGADSLDAFFDYEPSAPFCVIREWQKPWQIKFWRRPWVGNTSVFRFEAGALSFVFEKFMANIESAKRKVRHEQEFLCREMNDIAKIAYWPHRWCVSFKYGCAPTFPFNYFATPKIPAGARVVVFHGKPDPDKALVGNCEATGLRGIWRHIKPVPWIADEWR
ncbi:MAG: hypothetical protein LBR07_03805 [Puniceicoccales bacterium]|nr:hypothetical protein [Puniceicoccales bacterium]